MAAKKETRGRKDAYKAKIKPRFKEIAAWKAKGLTERQIAANIGVSYSTFNKYKVLKKEFSNLLIESSQPLISELRGALVRKALGYKYKETKTYSKTDAKGKTIMEYSETTEKEHGPDVAAIHLLLKNLDRNEDGSCNWSNDWNAESRKNKELALKEEMAKNNIWE